MRENVSIAYRGASYELGRGQPSYYGIWPVGADSPQPLEWWPETADGWYAAWSRFTQLEPREAIERVLEPDPPQPEGQTEPDPQPGQQTQQAEFPPGQFQSPYGAPAYLAYGQPLYGEPAYGPPRDAAMDRSPRAIAAAAVIGLGVAAGFIGLFPSYVGDASLASQSYNLTAHLIYLAAWTVGGVLLLAKGQRPRAGALLAAGVSAVTFGMFLADIGNAMAVGTSVMSAGLLLGLLSWLACTAGSVIGVSTLTGHGEGLRPRGHQVAPTITMIAAAIGAAIAFAPSWDRFTLAIATGATHTVTLGNAFSNPALMIAGDVAVMVAVVVVVTLAGLWRRHRSGAALLAGATIPLAAQAIAAVIQIDQPVSSTYFGISPAVAGQIGLTISSGLTLAFWIYCAFLVALGLSFLWMITSPDSGADVPVSSAAGYPLGPATAAPSAAPGPDTPEPASPITAPAPADSATAGGMPPGSAPAPGAQAGPPAASGPVPPGTTAAASG